MLYGVTIELIVIAGIGAIALLVRFSFFLIYSDEKPVWISERVGSVTKWKKSTEGGGCGCFLLVVVLVGIPWYLWSYLNDMSGNMRYECLNAGKYGPVIVLQKEAPLLYNNYIELDKMIEKEDKVVNILEKQKDEASSSGAKSLYDRQISEARARQEALKNMQRCINDVATDMYFSSYLKRLENDSFSPDFHSELDKIKQESDKLMKLHTSSYE